MTVAIEDPLIAGMAIRQTGPLHESGGGCASSIRIVRVCTRRRDGHCLAVGVAAVRGVDERSPLSMFGGLSAEEDRSRAAVAQHWRPRGPRRRRPWAAARARRGERTWDTGLETLGARGFRGRNRLGRVVDPKLRGCPTTRRCIRSVPLLASSACPANAGLTTWVRTASNRALSPLVPRLSTSVAARMSPSCGIIVGGCRGAATQVPLLAGSSESHMRLRQAFLDAFVGFGLPVRGSPRIAGTEGLA